MKGRTDWEDILKWLLPVWFIILFSQIFFPIATDDVWQDGENCIMEWVECEPDDRVGDCTVFTEKVITGPYYNKTEELKVTLKKEVCK